MPHYCTFPFFASVMGFLMLSFALGGNMSFEEKDKEILSKIKKNSKSYIVYMHLRDVGNLTVQKAMDLWGYYYPAVSINRLKKHGANIIDVNVGEDGKRKEIYAEWKLVKE